MPEPGQAGHATVEELRAAAVAQERGASRPAELENLVQEYRARLDELGNIGAWAAAKELVRRKSPPVADDVLEGLRAEVERLAAIEPAYFPVRTRD